MLLCHAPVHTPYLHSKPIDISHISQPCPQVAQPQPGSPPACGTAAAALQHPAGKDGAHACAAGTENTSPAALLRAVEQLDAKLRTATAPRPRIAQGGSRAPAKPDLQRQPAARQAQQPALRQRQAAAGGGAGAKGVAPSAPGPAGHDGARPLQSQAQGTAAAAVPPEPPVDPLEQLLRELLAAEGAGDPYSIINLYVTEQLQQVAAPAPARAGAAALPAGLQPAPETQGEAATATATATAAASTQGAIPSHSPPAVRPAQPEAAAMSQDVQVAAAAAELQPLPRAGLEEAHARELLPLREQQSLKPQPSESAPSTARHRRSSSLMLPQQFDVAAAADPAEWSIAAVGLGEADLPAANLGSGPAAGIPAGAVPPPQAIQCQQSAAAADSVPLDQPSGSKQLYVQQWLQRSAAELAAPESAPTSSSVAYSEDPDQASVQLEALPSLPSPGTDMAAPPAASSTAGKGGMAAAFPDCVAAASAGASPEAAAAAAPSGLSVASRSASAVTSTRRPGAPEPLSSSSQLDGSSSAPSRSRYASVSGTAAPPAALVPPPEEPQLQAPADDLSLGRSSWDGRSGAGSEEQEVQAALSFSQLQAVAVVDGAAGLLPSGGEQPTAVEGSESPCSPASRSSNAPSLGAAPHAHQPAPHPASSHTAATPGAAAALPVTAAAPTVGQSSVPSSDAYSSDFDSDFEDAEISYGVLDSGSTPAPPAVPAAAGPSAAAEQQAPPAAVAMETATADSSRPSSPRVLQPAPWQVGSGSPPGSAGAQPRPRSPHHAALDDRYPGSPPASGGSPALQLPMPGTTYSRPHSPVSLGASPRASGDGGVTSRPTSPCSAALGAAAEAGQPALQQEDTVVVHSPAGSSSSGGNSAGQAGSPYSLVQFGTEPASVAAAQEGAAAAAAAAAVVGSPPGTPVLASPGEDYGSCPGSARVDDDTVVQTGATGVQACNSARSHAQPEPLPMFRLQWQPRFHTLANTEECLTVFFCRGA